MRNYNTWMCLAILLCLTYSCTQSTKSLGPIPSDWFYTQRAFPHDKIDHKAHLQALRSYKQQSNYKSNTHNDSWIPKGPNNVGGRVTDIEMFSQDQQTILVGSASGGIFRSKDKGRSYEPIFDDALSLSIGDIDIAKSNENIIYVGTGEANAGGGSLAYDGVGVYKSTDKGDSWKHMGLEGVGSIGKVAVDPTDENTVYVAAMGRLFANNPDRGIYKTQDGGETWDHVLSVSDSTGGIDIVIDPSNTKIIYAAMWERKRRLNDLQYGGPTSGIYRSEDGGETWTNITTNIPTSFDMGRIGLAIAPSNPDRIYAYIARASGNILGVFTSVNKGESWTRKSNQGINTTSFMWWFGKITVSPDNENIVYVTSLYTNKSTNGGSFWTRVFRNSHVDQHSVFVHPQNPDLVVIGNDGGVYISEDAGDTYEKSADLPNMQFYAIEINNLQPHILAGGTQDNGTQMTFDGSVDNYRHILGGDGFRVVINPVDDQLMYAESQNGGIAKSTNGGLSFTNGSLGFNGAKNWNTPLTCDPQNPRVLYTGSNEVYRSFNAKRWVSISPDLTDGPYDGNRTFGTITTIDVSPIDRNILFAGTDDGNVHIGIASGRILVGRKKYEWTRISDDLPVRWVTSIAASPHDKRTVYVTLSGYRYDDGTAQVFVSRDLGESWSDIGSSLPDIPVNDIIPDPSREGTLYIATDAGVYISENDGNTWEILGQGLPTVPVTDIDYHQGEDFLIAATYGRSAFQYNFSPVIPSKPETPRSSVGHVSIYPNPSSHSIQINHHLQGENLQYIITDQVGSLIAQGTYQNDRIDIAHLQAQSYILTLQDIDRAERVTIPFVKM